eukprot:3596143-Rhodomonas_salina.1
MLAYVVLLLGTAFGASQCWGARAAACAAPCTPCAPPPSCQYCSPHARLRGTTLLPQCAPAYCQVSTVLVLAPCEWGGVTCSSTARDLHVTPALTRDRRTAREREGERGQRGT